MPNYSTFSFWEQSSFTNFDFAIVGSGITGSFTAYYLKKAHPSARIVVLERNALPTGATTRNAGFACFGSLTELLADEQTMGTQEMLQLVEKRWKGLQELRSVLGEEAIEYQQFGGYELINQKISTAEIERMNTLLNPIFNQEVYSDASNQLESIVGNNSNYQQLLYTPLEGQVHSGKLMQRLTQLNQSLGIEYLMGVSVESFQDEGSHVDVVTTDAMHRKLNLSVRKLVIATNAFAKSLLPNLELKPGRGLVLVTEPITNFSFQGNLHFDEGYYYLRNYQNRIIFGGGRNLDFSTEETTEFGLNERIQWQLEELLNTQLFPQHDIKVDYFWSGIMAFGSTKKIEIGLHSQNVGFAVRLGGMGIAVGAQVAKEISKLVSV